nr:uncharacterized protein LOC117274450 [Nicotiana tomentosiformis]
MGGQKSWLGKDAILRPPSGEEETPALVPKPTKDHKRKRASTSEDPQPKIRAARKPRKNTIPLTEESVRCLRDEDEEEEENDVSVLVARVKKTIDAPKAAGSMVVYEPFPRTEGISEKGSGKAPELLEIEDTSHRSQQTVDIFEGTDPEHLRTEQNAPSDLPTLPAFSEGAIREAQALGTLEIGRFHEGEIPFVICLLVSGMLLALVMYRAFSSKCNKL